MKEFEKLLLNTIKENILNEHYINLFPKDEAEKHKHKHEVFGLIQKSYEKIGGIHGDGFKDPDDMVKNIHMWKLKKKNGKIVAGKMYKNSKGIRKSVAAFTDGSNEGKSALANITKHEPTRSISEISASMLKFTKKHLGSEALQKYTKTPEEATKILNKHLDTKNIESEYDRDYPELKGKFYSRKIGDHYHTKILSGTEKKFY